MDHLQRCIHIQLTTRATSSSVCLCLGTSEILELRWIGTCIVTLDGPDEHLRLLLVSYAPVWVCCTDTCVSNQECCFFCLMCGLVAWRAWWDAVKIRFLLLCLNQDSGCCFACQCIAGRAHCRCYIPHEHLCPKYISYFFLWWGLLLSHCTGTILDQVHGFLVLFFMLLCRLANATTFEINHWWPLLSSESPHSQAALNPKPFLCMPRRQYRAF